ncbi:MAG: UDP-N-acetylmuramoyl-tripeptide--D-alanyl-D-alanine ligase [Bacteroidetes bacterium]|nr:UDP-N-acetylmuramoyl-tripeptide--D-alanyl-D-alanine ligase [Bacteroidota bacterium]
MALFPLTTVLLVWAMIRRARLFLHRAQLTGYKPSEFTQWVVGQSLPAWLPWKFPVLLITLGALSFWGVDWLSETALSVTASGLALLWTLTLGGGREVPIKKPLVWTPRVKRLSTTLFTISLAVLLAGAFVTLSPLLWQTGWGWVTGSAFNGLETWLSNPIPWYMWVLVVDMALPLWLLLALFVNRPIEQSVQRGYKKAAKKKLADHPGLTVVAITGSFGKTSTKYMLAKLLEQRYSVCFTPGSYNTPMGLCKVINQDLQSHHQVLLLEMGTRYPGDIAELCDLAQPDLSVITEVGAAHLDTLGSLDGVQEEKGTLAKRLKPGGALVLNHMNPRVSAMATWGPSNKTVWMAGWVEESPEQGDGEHGNGGRNGEQDSQDMHDEVWAGQKGADGINQVTHTHVRASKPTFTPEGSTFALHFTPSRESIHETSSTESLETQSAEISLPILGEHAVLNFTLAASAALQLGLRLETIASAASSMPEVEHRLQRRPMGDYLVLDDAFNSNPVGAKHALDVLVRMEGNQKWILTPGFVEMGVEQESLQRTFGEQLGQASLDGYLLIGPKQTSSIREGILASNPSMESRIHTFRSTAEAQAWLSEHQKPGDIILYENDLPDTYNE